MIPERDICELFSSLLPSGRCNACSESDCEIIQLPVGPNGLFTTDEFCAEDLFAEEDAYLLGWNIAAGAISDVLACGGTPLYYAHALTVPAHWEADYLRRFAFGVRDVLRTTGARFIGGDCGRSELWRCTASVIGVCEGKPVRRLGAAVGDSIYISGEVGAGNLQAALTMYRSQNSPPPELVKTQFPVRLRASALVRKFASSCIDTSDGVGAGLNTLADVNACGYAVADPPYLETGLRFCTQRSLPPILLLLGECGEYELLCTIPPTVEGAFLAEARDAACIFHRLGCITAAGRTLTQEHQTIDLGSWRGQAREFESVAQYLRKLINWLRCQAAVSTENTVSQET